MAARHGTISPTLRAGVPFLGGLRGGGGGWRLLCAPSLVGGGSPVGAPSGLAVKTRWRPLGPWAPSRKNLGFAGGDSAIEFAMYFRSRWTLPPLPPSKVPGVRPATVSLIANAAFNGICNQQKPLPTAPPTACPTAAGAALEVPSLLMSKGTKTLSHNGKIESARPPSHRH